VLTLSPDFKVIEKDLIALKLKYFLKNELLTKQYVTFDYHYSSSQKQIIAIPENLKTIL
jgi:hypothetical protein